jgi:hypothetical protein
LRHEGIGHQAPLISRQRDGAFDGRQALLDALRIAHMMLMKELFKCATPGELGGFEGWPLTKKVTKQSGVLMGKPLEHVRKIRLQRTDESMGYTDPISSQATPVFHQWGEGAYLGALSPEWRELVTMPQSELELECGIGRIVLRAARRQGVAISRQHHGIEVKEHEIVLCP